MCIDPATLAVIGTAVAGAASLYGSIKSSQAQSKAAAAIKQQNQETQLAQQQGFNTRIQAQQEQGKAIYDAQVQGLSDRTAAAAQMRQQQKSALDQQKSVLDAENAQAEKIRASGDQQARQLLDKTSGQNLAQGQEDAKNRQQALLDSQLTQSNVVSPDATDPYGSGDQGAYKRRMAQAATNIRDYGAKIADVGSYSQPAADVGLAVGENKYGIMPAAQADQLLRTGAPIRLMPSQLAYQGATNLGGAMDDLLKNRTEGTVGVANLAGGNAISIANLGQANADTLAKNKADQAKADADYQKSVGGIISGLGNLGLYASGYKWGDALGIAPSPVKAA